MSTAAVARSHGPRAKEGTPQMGTQHLELTDSQQRLLADLGRAWGRSTERFMMLRTVEGVWLQHPGLPEGTRDIDFADAAALRDLGLLGEEPANWGGFHFVLTPAGVEASEALRREPGKGS